MKNHKAVIVGDWSYTLLQGDLSFNGKQYQTPQDYITAFDHFVTEKKSLGIVEDIPSLDYTAIHLPTKTAVTQLWGKRYIDQQDSFAIGQLAHFPACLGKDKIKQILRQTFQRLHHELIRHDARATSQSGACCCLAIVHRNEIITAHLGDSVAYHYESSPAGHFALINQNLHRAGSEREYQRIANFLKNKHSLQKATILAGMRNPFDPRLHDLAITAALGDTNYDALGLLHIPDEQDIISIKTNALKKNFIIVATDGLTEQLSDPALKKIVRSIPNQQAATISLALARAAYESGSTDNITVMVKEIDPSEETATYLTVFDGHGGNVVAQISAKIFANILNQAMQGREKEQKK